MNKKITYILLIVIFFNFTFYSELNAKTAGKKNIYISKKASTNNKNLSKNNNSKTSFNKNNSKSSLSFTNLTILYLLLSNNWYDGDSNLENYTEEELEGLKREYNISDKDISQTKIADKIEFNNIKIKDIDIDFNYSMERYNTFTSKDNFISKLQNDNIEYISATLNKEKYYNRKEIEYANKYNITNQYTDYIYNIYTQDKYVFNRNNIDINYKTPIYISLLKDEKIKINGKEIKAPIDIIFNDEQDVIYRILESNKEIKTINKEIEWNDYLISDKSIDSFSIKVDWDTITDNDYDLLLLQKNNKNVRNKSYNFISDYNHNCKVLDEKIIKENIRMKESDLFRLKTKTISSWMECRWTMMVDNFMMNNGNKIIEKKVNKYIDFKVNGEKNKEKLDKDRYVFVLISKKENITKILDFSSSRKYKFYEKWYWN